MVKEADQSVNNELISKEENSLKKKSKSRLESDSSQKSVPKRVKMESKKSALDLAIEKKKAEQSTGSAAGKLKASAKKEKVGELKSRKVKVSPPQM